MYSKMHPICIKSLECIVEKKKKNIIQKIASVHISQSGGLVSTRLKPKRYVNPVDMALSFPENIKASLWWAWWLKHWKGKSSLCVQGHGATSCNSVSILIRESVFGNRTLQPIAMTKCQIQQILKIHIAYACYQATSWVSPSRWQVSPLSSPPPSSDSLCLKGPEVSFH